MQRTDPQYKLRIPESLKSVLEEAAKEGKRSLNAEIVARLEASVFKDAPATALVSAQKARELAASARKDIAASVRQLVLKEISYAISAGQSRVEVELTVVEFHERDPVEIEEIVVPLLKELEGAGYQSTFELDGETQTGTIFVSF